MGPHELEYRRHSGPPPRRSALAVASLTLGVVSAGSLLALIVVPSAIWDTVPGAVVAALIGLAAALPGVLLSLGTLDRLEDKGWLYG